MANFGINIKILLINNVKKIYYKEAINIYTNKNKIDIIIILKTNLKSEISSK